MSRSSVTSKRSQRRSKDSSRCGASAQSADLDEQPPPQINTVPPVDNKEENCEPSVVESSFGISNSGTPQPSDPHAREDTINDLPQGTLTTDEKENVAQEDQPTLSDIMKVVEQVFDVLKDSTIASKTGKDKRSRFLAAYKKVAEEHDDEFLEQYNSNMDVMLIFSGLFSAVSTAFIVAMESNLSPDPNDTTHALLAQLVQIGLGNFTAAESIPVAPASNWSPPIASIKIQCIAYASLSFSLLAAFGAVLGKQWLGYYKSQRYGRGSEEERAKRRQVKFDGIITWYLDAVVQSFPILLQFSLFLFGIALGANMWYEQHTVAWVILATTAFGFLFYSLTVMAALISPTCPFQTPVSAIFERVLRQIVKLTFVLAARSFAWRCLQQLFGAFQRLRLWWRSSTGVVDPEAQAPAQNRNDQDQKQCLLKLTLHDIPINDLEAPGIMWLMETSTDPEVFDAAASLVPDVDWPLDIDVSDTLHQLYDVYMTCLDVQQQIIPSLKEKASVCTNAICHLYCRRILQGCDNRFFNEGHRDIYVFKAMLKRTEVNAHVLVATIKLSVAKYGEPWWPSSPKFGACPDSVPLLEWLSRTLSFHFVTGKVDEDVEELAITVISKLLCSHSSPSPQITANCTFLACVMFGVQFDKKDIVRVDKSSALPQLAEALWTQFEKVWASDRGHLDEDNTGVRRAWKLFNPIYRVIALYPPSASVAWMLDVRRKIYSRARSSQYNHRDSSAAMQIVQCFGFAFDSNKISGDPADPAWLWRHTIPWQGDSHSPEDFDWLVDYLGDVCSNDHKTAGDILVLLNSMGVSCSPAEQHPFTERLIVCMGSSMPPRLRHAALCVVYSSREVLASIDVVDDADTVLNNLSRAILTAVCPQPDATRIHGGPDRFFHHNRDLCYLELIFALARNSHWRPHLHCQMDRAIRIITECCRTGKSHAFYLIGFFLRMTSEEVSSTSLSSITEQQWWAMIRRAWYYAHIVIDDTHCVEFLPVLVDETKKYKGITSNDDIKQLIKDVDRVMHGLERQDQGDVEKLRSMIKGMLNELSK